MIDEQRETPARKPAWPGRTRALQATLAVVTLVVVFLNYTVLRPFVPALAWALALAVIAGPVHRWIAARVRWPGLAAGLAVVVVAVVIVVPTVLVSRRIASDAGSILEWLQQEADTGNLRRTLLESPFLASVIGAVETQVDPRALGEQLRGSLGPRIAELLKGSVWAIVELLVALFALFFFLRDRDAALRAARCFVPLSERETDRLFRRIHDTIHATVFGTGAVALVQGTLGGLMFWWLGLPSPLVWGAVMALLSVIPTLGTFVVWAPAAAFLLLTGEWGKALVLAAWGLTVVSTVDNLLYPMLVGRELRMHTLPVFLAVVGGLMAFGASGVVIGPVLLATQLALAEFWRERLGLADCEAAETE